mmetsp:Transcript_13902/g.43154  ORF Transcript_13902/g.43154 Transcript_13902/m.43154 type:complete len:253 (-) Transcript_13902:14-772(-)
MGGRHRQGPPEEARAAARDARGERRGLPQGDRGIHGEFPERRARGLRAHRQGRLGFARHRRDHYGGQVGQGRQGLPQDVRRRDADVPAAAEAARPRAARARHGRLGRSGHRRVGGGDPPGPVEAPRAARRRALARRPGSVNRGLAEEEEAETCPEGETGGGGGATGRARRDIVNRGLPVAGARRGAEAPGVRAADAGRRLRVRLVADGPAIARGPARQKEKGPVGVRDGLLDEALQAAAAAGPAAGREINMC